MTAPLFVFLATVKATLPETVATPGAMAWDIGDTDVVTLLTTQGSDEHDDPNSLAEVATTTLGYNPFARMEHQSLSYTINGIRLALTSALEAVLEDDDLEDAEGMLPEAQDMDDFGVLRLRDGWCCIGAAQHDHAPILDLHPFAESGFSTAGLDVLRAAAVAAGLSAPTDVELVASLEHAVCGLIPEQPSAHQALAQQQRLRADLDLYGAYLREQDHAHTGVVIVPV